MPLCWLAALGAPPGEASGTSCAQPSIGTSLLLVRQDLTSKGANAEALREDAEEPVKPLRTMHRDARAVPQLQGARYTEEPSGQPARDAGVPAALSHPAAPAPRAGDAAWRLRLLGVMGGGEFPSGPWVIVGLVSLGIFVGLLLVILWQCCCLPRKRLSILEDEDDLAHEAWVRTRVVRTTSICRYFTFLVDSRPSRFSPWRSASITSP